MLAPKAVREEEASLTDEMKELQKEERGLYKKDDAARADWNRRWLKAGGLKSTCHVACDGRSVHVADEPTPEAGQEVILMNPASGTVQSLEDWQADYKNTEPELWGGTDFEDAALVPVTWDEKEGCWKEQ